MKRSTLPWDTANTDENPTDVSAFPGLRQDISHLCHGTETLHYLRSNRAPQLSSSSGSLVIFCLQDAMIWWHDVIKCGFQLLLCKRNMATWGCLFRAHRSDWLASSHERCSHAELVGRSGDLEICLVFHHRFCHFGGINNFELHPFLHCISLSLWSPRPTSGEGVVSHYIMCFIFQVLIQSKNTVYSIHIHLFIAPIYDYVWHYERNI